MFLFYRQRNWVRSSSHFKVLISNRNFSEGKYSGKISGDWTLGFQVS